MHLSVGSGRGIARALGALGGQATEFAAALGARQPHPGRLLVVGSPDLEPWHFTAHLGEHALRRGRRDLVPVLLRWNPPPGAPPHLAVSVDELGRASRHDSVLVIDPFDGTDTLLQRVSDARHRGARVLSLHRGQDPLVELSHETLSVERRRPVRDFDLTQHLVTEVAARERIGGVARWAPSRVAG